MTPNPPRIAIPEPSSTNPDYSQQSWPVYAEAIESSGGMAVKLPLHEPPATLAQIIRSCSAVLLPGSPADLDPEKYGEHPSEKCNPKDGMRESADELLLQDAFNLRKPILGICYGMQSLNVWKSGTLIQDLPSFRLESGHEGEVNHRPGREVKNAHPVTIMEDSLLAKILEGTADLERDQKFMVLSVNSSHHQAVAEAGDEMRVVALSPQDGVIEALEGESPRQFVLAVQWHPERTYSVSPASQALFAAFVEAARAWRPRPIDDSVQESDRNA